MQLGGWHSTFLTEATGEPYGFKSYKVYETVLYHELRRLPEHELAHQFC